MREGDVLDGKYRVEKVIGEGGMGVVVAATHLHLQERVALKFLLLEVTRESELATRFLREAQAAVKIKSEHVARVSDVGTLESGTPYMVMEYLEGEDLEALLMRQGPLPVEDVVDYTLQACQAIASAHHIGIVHRDLKPSNLFLTHRTDGSACIKVLDFGISKMADSSARITKTTGSMGTPAYMSPEQLRSARDVDARTDVWSLGVILHELLTNRLPFAGESVPELCASILTAPVAPVRLHAPEVPDELERVIAKCLKKDPSDRYATVVELALALDPFASETMRGTARRLARITTRGGRPSLSEAAAARVSRPSPAEMASTEVGNAVALDEPVALEPMARWPWVAAGTVAFAAVVAILAWPPSSAAELEVHGVPEPPSLPTSAKAQPEPAPPSTAVPSSSSVRARPKVSTRPIQPAPLPAKPATTDSDDYGGRK